MRRVARERTQKIEKQHESRKVMKPEAAIDVKF